MTCDDEAQALLLFAAADATWRCEAAKVLGRDAADPGLVAVRDAQGNSGTLLRTAFEVRERAHAEWQRVRLVEANLSEA